MFEINRIDFAKYNPDEIVPLNKILNIGFTIELSLFSCFLRIAFTTVLTTCNPNVSLVLTECISITKLWINRKVSFGEQAENRR